PARISPADPREVLRVGAGAVDRTLHDVDEERSGEERGKGGRHDRARGGAAREPHAEDEDEQTEADGARPGADPHEEPLPGARPHGLDPRRDREVERVDEGERGGEREEEDGERRLPGAARPRWGRLRHPTIVSPPDTLSTWPVT